MTIPERKKQSSRTNETRRYLEFYWRSWETWEWRNLHLFQAHVHYWGQSSPPRAWGLPVQWAYPLICRTSKSHGIRVGIPLCPLLLSRCIQHIASSHLQEQCIVDEQAARNNGLVKRWNLQNRIYPSAIINSLLLLSFYSVGIYTKNCEVM